MGCCSVSDFCVSQCDSALVMIGQCHYCFVQIKKIGHLTPFTLTFTTTGNIELPVNLTDMFMDTKTISLVTKIAK